MPYNVIECGDIVFYEGCCGAIPIPFVDDFLAFGMNVRTVANILAFYPAKIRYMRSARATTSLIIGLVAKATFTFAALSLALDALSLATFGVGLAIAIPLQVNPKHHYRLFTCWQMTLHATMAYLIGKTLRDSLETMLRENIQSLHEFDAILQTNLEQNLQDRRALRDDALAAAQEEGDLEQVLRQ